MLHVPYVHISVHRTGRSASLSKLLGQELHNHSGKLGYCYTSATHVLLLLGAVCRTDFRGDGYDEVDTPAHTPRIKWLMLLFRTLPRLKMPDRAAKCEMRQRNATAICDREKATKRKIPKRPSAAFRLPTSLNNRYIHIMREVDHFTHYLTDALYYTFSFTDWDSSRSSILRITLFVCSARLSVKICHMSACEFQQRVIDVSYRVW